MAQAQPNTSEAHDSAGASMLDLASAPGGRQIPAHLIAVAAEAVLGKVAAMQMDVIAHLCKMERGDNITPQDVQAAINDTFHAWSRDDGSLLMRSTDEDAIEVVIPPGGWEELAADEAERNSVSWAAEMRSERGQAMLREMAITLQERSTAEDAAEARMVSAMAGMSAVASVFSKRSESLLTLKETIGNHSQARSPIDAWLQSDSEFIVLWRARTGQATAILAKDEAELMAQALPAALGFWGPPDSIALAIATGDEGLDVRATSWWKGQGGISMNELAGQLARHGH